MELMRARRRLFAWVAMVIMALGSLAPALAQGMSGSAGAMRWVELCTASGMVMMPVEADAPVGVGSAQSLPADGQSMPPCPWCLLHGGAPALPPSADATVLPLRLAHDFPPTFYRAPVLSFVWAPQHSRAPPGQA